VSQGHRVGFVLYGCETWCQTVRGKYRAMMFGNGANGASDRRMEKTA
jgi:hypothetical protein